MKCGVVIQAKPERGMAAKPVSSTLATGYEDDGIFQNGYGNIDCASHADVLSDYEQEHSIARHSAR